MLSVKATKLILKWIWIFLCILEEFPAISSFFRDFSGHTLMFWNTKHKIEQHKCTLYKFYKYNVHCTNFTNTLNDFVVQISEKELIFSDKYFNGNS